MRKRSRKRQLVWSDERILELSESAQDKLIRELGSIAWEPTAGLLIRIYELCDGEDGRPELRPLVMSYLRFFKSPRVRQFIVRELRRHKYDWLGDWAIIALVGENHSPADFDLLVSVFEDPKAIDSTRESAVKGMSCVLSGMAMRGIEASRRVTAKAREITAQALKDPFPETRVAGIWLAREVGGFEAELRHIAETDHAKARGGTVAEEAAIDFEGAS